MKVLLLPHHIKNSGSPILPTVTIDPELPDAAAPRLQNPRLRLTHSRCAEILSAVKKARVLIVGDLMLDQFISGDVLRISPEAPVPVVRFSEEHFMPGGAANIGWNVRGLGAAAALFGVVGRDEHGRTLARVLKKENIDTRGLVFSHERATSVKTRITSGTQQILRLDRETHAALHAEDSAALWKRLEAQLADADAMIIGDYAKGVITPSLMDLLRKGARKRKLWLSLDPKPDHPLRLEGLSLLTPNRREAFLLAGMTDGQRGLPPLKDARLLKAAEVILERLAPTLLLITLSEQGMLLCEKSKKPVHIQTVAREVFDVSGAGDTVIASFTLAITAGASPLEAAVFANHAAGIVVGKFGTSAVTPKEFLESVSNA